MFSGFDDGGWWLGVEGCWGGVGDHRSWPERTQNLPEASYRGEERRDRKWSFWIEL